MHLHVAGLDIPDTQSVSRNTNVTLTRSVYWGWEGGGGGSVRTRED